MAVLQSIVINLTNTDNAPYTWNVGGGNLGLPPAERKTTYAGSPTEPAIKPGSYIGTATESVPLDYKTFIPTPDEVVAGASALSDQVAEVSLTNEQMKAMPIQVNKIKIYTDNPDQYKEAFTYYQQNAAGEFESKRLNVLPHYDPLNPRAKVEIGPEYLGGVLTLDGNRRIEVKHVLAKTILIIELLFEYDDPLSQLGIESKEPSFGNFDLDDEEEKDEEQEESETPEVDFDPAKIAPFVDTFYDPARRSQQKTGVPVLFSLAQAALEEGWELDRLGNNMFGVKAGDKWQGSTVTRKVTQCDPPEEDATGAVSFTVEPKGKTCKGKPEYTVSTLLREYPAVVDSFLDRARLYGREPYLSAFTLKGLPYEFATAIVEAGYEPTEDYGTRIHLFMEAIEPFLSKWERLEEAKKRAERQKKTVFLAVTAVLTCVLILAVVKPLLFKKLLLISAS